MTTLADPAAEGLADTPTTFPNAEGYTEQVAGWLEEQLDPRGVGVAVDAEHLCMTSAVSRPRGSAPSPRPCAALAATMRG